MPRGVVINMNRTIYHSSPVPTVVPTVVPSIPAVPVVQRHHPYSIWNLVAQRGNRKGPTPRIVKETSANTFETWFRTSLRTESTTNEKLTSTELERGLKERTQQNWSIEPAVVPGFEIPTSLLYTALKPHQISGVAWAQQKELTVSPGGLIMDVPGTGKTLTMITTILLGLTQQSQQHTLVVCPATLLTMWVDEFRRHAQHPVTMLLYHGHAKHTHTDLNDFNVVITSYHSLLSSPSLFIPVWDRIVLDEAHAIRNQDTHITAAVRKLLAKARWCLTATPVVNSLHDLITLFKFLHLCPETVTNLTAIEIQELLREHAIRRGKSILSLPTKKEVTVQLDFSNVERRLYNALFAYTKCRIKMAADVMQKMENRKNRKEQLEQDIAKQFRHQILALILRLRQLCNHTLIPLLSWPWTRSLLLEAPSIDEGMENVIRGLLEDPDDSAGVEKCQLCWDPISFVSSSVSTSFSVLPCAHVFCPMCLKKLSQCPFCLGHKRYEIKEKEGNEEEEKETTTTTPKKRKPTNLLQSMDVTLAPSAKVVAILQLLFTYREHKIVIVSQWVDMLSIIAYHLALLPWCPQWIQIDGSRTPKARGAMIHEFQENPEIRFALVSLLAGCEGITLHAADRMIICDHWWNQAKHEQAEDRIHRLGQESECQIVYLQVQDTMEKHINDISSRKGTLFHETCGASVSNVNRKTKKNNSQWIAEVQQLFD